MGRIVVNGASGQIGRLICERLAQETSPKNLTLVSVRRQNIRDFRRLFLA